MPHSRRARSSGTSPKREALFADEDDIHDEFVSLIRRVPSTLSPIGVMEHALEAAGATLFEPSRAYLVRWRGVDPDNADLLARACMPMFQTAVARWLASGDTEPGPLARYLGEEFDRLRDVITPR